MPLAHIVYHLHDGFIDHWLTTGPQFLGIEGPSLEPSADDPQHLAARLYEKKSGVVVDPVEQGPLNEGILRVGNFSGAWQYTRCREDHWVNHSRMHSECAFARSWAYTQVVSKQPQTATFRLNTYGAVDVWVNKKAVFHSLDFSTDAPLELIFSADLKQGKNEFLVRFAAIAEPGLALLFSVQVLVEGIELRIPTLIPSVERRNELEALYEKMYLDRDIYVGNQTVQLCWPEDVPEGGQDVRLQTASGRIYAQAEDIGKAGLVLKLVSPPSVPQGPYRALIMPRAWELYESNIRITKELPAWVMGRSRFSSAPYGTPETRVREALVHAAQHENAFFAEISKMALGAWADVEEKVVRQGFERIRQGQAGSVMELLGLLGALMRLGDQPAFPGWMTEQARLVVEGFAFGQEANCPANAPLQEGRAFTHIVCQVMAGAWLPESVFAVGGSGQKLRADGEAQALAWMHARARLGFADWDSKAGLAEIFAALSYLVDLCETAAVVELASVLLDKLLFTLAVNSFQGVVGVPQRRALLENIQSGLLEETSGITRVLWGMGVFNHHLAGIVAAACLKDYDFPPIVAEIALGEPQGQGNHQQYALEGEAPVNLVSYRTGNYLLASAQDYSAGRPGRREHIWQATLGEQAVVFVNHPGSACEQDSPLPGFWVGNGVLPRVAQWQDTLIALYQLPADDRMRFTHAYFPSIEFDETVLQRNTAFARKGSTYLALTCSAALEMVKTGHTALRELRAYGRQVAWVCQMGSSAQHGDFATFQEMVLANPPEVNGLEVTMRTLQGDTLHMGWQGAFLRNGAEQPLHNFAHFDNPYTHAELPCQTMEIKTQNYLLGLNFEEEEES